MGPQLGLVWVSAEYPLKLILVCVLFCFVWCRWTIFSGFLNSFTHIVKGCFTDTGAIMRYRSISPIHQWNKYPTMHHFVTSVTHNTQLCIRNVHVCAFLLQSGALLDVGLVHCGICEMDLLISTKTRQNTTNYNPFTRAVESLILEAILQMVHEPMTEIL